MPSPIYALRLQTFGQIARAVGRQYGQGFARKEHAIGYIAAAFGEFNEPLFRRQCTNLAPPSPLKPVSPAALKSVIADFKAKQQQGGGRNLLQNGPTQNANAKPIGTADINTNQLGTLKPFGTAPALTPEASASNARLAAASAKTSDHSLLKRDVTDALKTGGAQAQAEVRDLTQQMDQLQPGSGTKLAQEVGLKPKAHPGLPPRKPETSDTNKIDMDKNLETLRNGKSEDVQVLAKQLEAMKASNPKAYASMPSELAKFYEGYKNHMSQIPSAPNPKDPKYQGNPASIKLAQKKHIEMAKNWETMAVRTGTAAAASDSVLRAFQAPVAESALNMYAGTKALSGNALTANQIAQKKAITKGLVPGNYKSALSVQAANALGKGLGFVGADLSIGSALSGGGTNAISAVQNGGTLAQAKTQAWGGAAANLLGGQIAGNAIKTVKAAKSSLLSADVFKSSPALKALEKMMGLAAGEGLTGMMGGVEGKKRPNEPIQKD